ncbi:hypothetical protein MGYG_00154 [Nannizzia gypsea CBS 118893]|uniref:DUF202 domain-containing protein n=1 Tax=Arthroderma gypseum (strain ATCC MYA-4604 / CBS 118893) TaxID=535722 RepID=E5R383_ARTGP|nr:hypothetical protein MGYG_00154 [Nannizzia gypsea CBS 118893]EFQ97112.1 hypothetical protein MGYG_00154 [Nannizzia gypsea CBS 118893]
MADSATATTRSGSRPNYGSFSSPAEADSHSDSGSSTLSRDSMESAHTASRPQFSRIRTHQSIVRDRSPMDNSVDGQCAPGAGGAAPAASDNNHFNNAHGSNVVNGGTIPRQRGASYSSQRSRKGSIRPEQPLSWYKRMLEKYGSLELENKGSVARDHLALERTFLSWLRTSLAFASIGIAVTQLFRLNTAIQQLDPSLHRPSDPTALLSEHYRETSKGLYFTITSNSSQLRGLGKPLGATFIGVAILVLFIGFHRYFESQYWVVRGKFPASRGSIALTAFITASLMVSSLVIILTISPGATES